MNRKIKFRAWDKEENRMRYWDTLRLENYFIDGIYGAIKINRLGDNLSYTSDTKLELMQFTGLKDKNGKEIYEEDIVKRSWGKNTTTEQVEDMGFDLRYSLLESGGMVEIIGNIYENPELLK